MRYGTEKARCHTATTMRNKNFLIPSYYSQHLAKVRMLNVQPEISLVWLVVALLAGLEDEVVTILKVKKILQQNWSGIALKLTLQCRQNPQPAT